MVFPLKTSKHDMVLLTSRGHSRGMSYIVSILSSHGVKSKMPWPIFTSLSTKFLSFTISSSFPKTCTALICPPTWWLIPFTVNHQVDTTTYQDGLIQH